MRRFTDELLLGIEHRGRHATGFVAVSTNGRNKKPKVLLRKKDIQASDFIKTNQVPINTRAALLHTRFATQGPAEDMANNHPVLWNTCFVTHNGQISNDDSVIKDCGVEGTRIGEVDSFAIPVALVNKGYNTDDELSAGLHMLQGGFAIAMLDPVVSPGEVVLAKGEGSPLTALYTEHGIFWASERKVLEDAWGKVLGTPPKGFTRDFSKDGFFSFGSGEFVRFKANEGATQGRFEVNRAPFRGGGWHGAGYNGKKTWTCFPSVGNCLFGKECGDCTKIRCRCYAENTWHPRINRDLTWEDAIKDNDARKWLQKHKLSRKDVGPYNYNREATPRVAEKPREQRAIRTHGGEDFAKCDFCEGSAYYPVSAMTTVYTTGGRKFRCPTCHDRITHERGDTSESDARQLAIMVSSYENLAGRWEDIVDEACHTVGFANGISHTLVHYMVFLQKKADGKTVWGEFQRRIRQEFKEVVNEEQEAVKAEEAKK